MRRRIYDEIESEYDRRRKNAHDRTAAKREEVYLEVPQLREIEDRINKAGVRYSRLIVSGEEDAGRAAADLQNEINELKEKRTALLTENGYPEDYLDPVYVCNRCNDTGFDGFERCYCYRQQFINHLYRESNLFRLDDENWGTFNEKYYPDVVDEKKYGIRVSPRKNILYIRERCKDFIDNFNVPERRNLFFSGPPGTGKTFMASCIAGELLEKGHTVLYQTAPALFNAIGEYKARAYHDGEFEDEIYLSIFTVELLIMDDLGTETTTSSRYAELLNILNTREINNTRKPCKTIISTNLSPKMLYERYTERVGSRIIGNFERLAFAGDDIRVIKASE
jgi:DNA replication protein DnaC